MCTVSLDFESLTRTGLIEEPMHPRVAGEGQRMERTEGAISEKR